MSWTAVVRRQERLVHLEHLEQVVPLEAEEGLVEDPEIHGYPVEKAEMEAELNQMRKTLLRLDGS